MNAITKFIILRLQMLLLFPVFIKLINNLYYCIIPLCLLLLLFISIFKVLRHHRTLYKYKIEISIVVTELLLN